MWSDRGTPRCRAPACTARSSAAGPSLVRSGGGSGLPPPGSRCLQDCCADLNAGACVLIPELEPRIWMLLPVTFGSGKLGTACERMHLANASAPANLPCPVRPLLLLVGLAEPQAAIATAQPSAASPTDIRRPWPLRVLIVVVLCT